MLAAPERFDSANRSACHSRQRIEQTYHLGVPTYDFPQDLRDAQIALHQTRAELERFASTLPWSAEPMPGWQSEKQLHSEYRSTKQDSPGYTEEQRDEIARLRKRLRELSVTVTVHPFWQTLGGSEVVGARMALKHAHEAVEDQVV